MIVQCENVNLSLADVCNLKPGDVYFQAKDVAAAFIISMHDTFFLMMVLCYLYDFIR
jgi:hypothetical protein